MTKLTLILTSLFLWLCHPAQAQTNEDISETILQQDSLFWVAYNHCDVAAMHRFFTDDVEFYHDKGGVTKGVENQDETIRKNLCSNENFRLRREAVQGSVKVFPMHRSGTVYGAIISGEHTFTILEKGKEERLDGLAKFTHLWILENGTWKMSRVLSYDHGPAVAQTKGKERQLPVSVLDQFVGKYKAPQAGMITVQRQENGLVLLVSGQEYTLYAETENRFLIKDRDLTFEFRKDNGNKVSGFVVRENGKIVDEALVQK